jgi:gas vesicle protein
MANGKVIAGVAVGVLVALILIPKSRKMLSDGLCYLTDSMKSLANQAEEISGSAQDVAGNVNSVRQAIN